MRSLFARAGTIEMDEFCKVFDIKNGVLAKSIWGLYDGDKSKTVDFAEFVTGLAKNLQLKSAEDKLNWAFDVYDLDKDGMLTFTELERCLQDKNVNLPWGKKQMKSIFSEKACKKQSISRKEFCQVAKDCPTLQFPAFIMLDTLNAKAFEMKGTTAKPDAEKDLEKAKETKNAR